ncbi:MAG: hypothetical protein JSW27_25650 [Phycisphaerales bacterium]|nr:MAG: hypothetical protein JSW27_25650 [Phycisphaerales bacterium]
MKRAVHVSAWGICLLALVWLAAGCGASQTHLAETGVIHLEQAQIGKVYVAWSEAYEDGDGFVITGVVRRNDTVGAPIKVKVQAAITSPEGELVGEAQSEDICVPRWIATKVQGFERFEIRLPSVPPEGSVVRVVARSS